MKRFLGLTLAILMLLSIMMPVVNAADTTDQMTFTASSTKVNVGDNVTLTMQTSVKIGAADFTINYDSNLLQFVSINVDSQPLEEVYYNADNLGKIQVCKFGTSGMEKFDFIFKTKAKGTATVSTAVENLSTDTTAESAISFKDKTVSISIEEKAADINVDVTSVTLDKTQVSVDVGATAKLNATVLPSNATNKTVTWKSSDTTVATVSNGTVTGIKAGTATITATAGTKSTTCTVTVAENKIDVTSITLDKKMIEFVKVGETLKLNATVLPEDATDKTVTWESSDTSIATVSNGTVTGIKAGSATITATAGKKSATCTVTVTNKTPQPGPSTDNDELTWTDFSKAKYEIWSQSENDNNNLLFKIENATPIKSHSYYVIFSNNNNEKIPSTISSEKDYDILLSSVFSSNSYHVPKEKYELNGDLFVYILEKQMDKNR